MKRKIFALLMVLGIFVAASSCQKDELEEPSLSLSQTSVDLQKSASSKDITVTTNQSEWSAMSNVNWIDLTMQGTTLKITATENLSPNERKGKVMVLAGGLSKSIEVKQTGSDVSLVTIPEKLDVDQYGGNYQFDVKANTQDWTITTDAKWITITPKQFKNEVLVSIAENKEKTPRVAKLILTGGKTVKEFTVNQSGIIYYILPYFGFGEKASAVRKFETTRKSELVKQPDGLFNQSAWDFETKSSAFSLIRYEIPKDSYKEAIVFAATKDLLTNELKGFTDFLKENGFKDNGNNTFLNSEKNIVASIMDKAENPYVSYKFIPKQPQAYPTFDKVPYGLIDFASDKAKVDAYEATNGGVFNAVKSSIDKADSDTDYLWFDVNKNDAYARAYFVNRKDGEPKTLQETAQYFSKMTLAFWDNKGELTLTNEFMALMLKDGFTYKGLNKTWHVFDNAAKKINMVLRYVKYKDLEIPVLDIHVYSTATKSSLGEITKKDNNTTGAEIGLSKDAKLTINK